MARKKTCNACLGKYASKEQTGGQYYNCMTIPGGVDSDNLPECCWQMAYEDKELVSEVLQFLHRSKEARSKRFQLKVSMCQTILKYPQLNDDTARALEALYGKGKRKKRFLVDAKTPRLYEFLHKYLIGTDALNWQQLNQESTFAKSLALFKEYRWKIHEKRQKRGHNCVPISTQMQINSASKFCLDIQNKGYTTWLQVSQRDIDEYTLNTNVSAGGYAAGFVRFALKKAKINTKIITPKRKKTLYRDLVLGDAELDRLIASTAKLDCIELKIVTLFLAIYAQRINHSLRLRPSNFRLHKGHLEVLFSEQWLRLDDKTASLLLEFKPDLAAPVKKDNSPIFSYSNCYYIAKINKIGFKAIEVRLGAVARLIRLGSIKRGAIRAIFGVSFNTLSRIERTMQWDLQQTVEQSVVQRRNRIIRGESLDD